MKFISSTFTALILFFGFGHAGFAQSSFNKEDAAELAREAAQTQLNLTENERSLEEIEQALDPYFTDEFIDGYMKENVHKGNEKYIVYGSDFTPYGIPFFNYDENMKFSSENSKLKLYQFFPAEDEGPVSYEDHFETVEFTKEDGSYKISSIQYSDQEPKAEAAEEKKEDDSAINVSMLFTNTFEDLNEAEPFQNKQDLSFLWTSYFKAKNFLTAYYQPDQQMDSAYYGE
ncbi:DUF3993 domain-containing protein [Bacillus idriensis]|uniref:DUF3993 domain-containing protein n=1 Tax=Metabacillus idriensis TaxID=324768 RepID=A0A6I2MC69_9BACI|nr:DUF3993 domain-containing protein [Metabacillus idriensis]MRX53383.1 DUF3993 domain-containing protein [Metabacillus idriensis]